VPNYQPTQLSGSRLFGGNPLEADFWVGLWQRFIVTFVFVISLFKSGLNIYDVHNNGTLYNFG